MVVHFIIEVDYAVVRLFKVVVGTAVLAVSMAFEGKEDFNEMLVDVPIVVSMVPAEVVINSVVMQSKQTRGKRKM